MGQKVNPIGFRTAVHKQWKSRWFAERKEFGDLLNEDLVIREMVQAKLKDAAVADIVIERYAQRARVTVFTARPGVVIGRKGEGIDKLREELSAKTGKEIYVEIKEVRSPDTNAQLVAESIALQLERRVAFRRAMKRALQLTMDMGALGIRVQAWRGTRARRALHGRQGAPADASGGRAVRVRGSEHDGRQDRHQVLDLPEARRGEGPEQGEVVCPSCLNV